MDFEKFKKAVIEQKEKIDDLSISLEELEKVRTTTQFLWSNATIPMRRPLINEFRHITNKYYDRVLANDC